MRAYVGFYGWAQREFRCHPLGLVPLIIQHELCQLRRESLEHCFLLRVSADLLTLTAQNLDFAFEGHAAQGR